MNSNFQNRKLSGNPAVGIAEITPNDSTDLVKYGRAITVAADTTMKVTCIDDSVGTIFVAAGAIFPLCVKRIWDTGTSPKTGIVVLF